VLVVLVLVPISCYCWSFSVAGPIFLSRAGVRIRFCFFDSVPSLRQFPVLVQESVFGSYTQESASELRSPHQFGFAGDFFFGSCCDFFSAFSLLPARSEARRASGPKCVAQILSAQAVRSALFSHRRSSVSLLLHF
jgi:hypothetical protein